MAEADPRTVLTTDSHKVASTVVDWLGEVGIEAELLTPQSGTSTDPLTGMSEGGPAEEFEVRVVNPAKVEEARKLLSSAQRTAMLHQIHEQRAQRTGTVTAVCEECGQSSEWPASAMGTTETCPHCHKFMDIPDPDDDWSGIDFGQPEDEAEEAKE